jgi:hypothetical protein
MTALHHERQTPMGWVAMRKQAGSGGVWRPRAITREARTTALRLGWNDAAWGRSRREVDDLVAAAYERGYVGGLAFRRKQEAIPPELVCVPRDTEDPMMPPMSKSA